VADEPKCSQCGGELHWDEVNIGVGIMTGPKGCPACGWSEYDREAAQKELGADWYIDPYGGATRIEAIDRVISAVVELFAEVKSVKEDSCYFADQQVCTGELWECLTCREHYCQKHWHRTSKGENVECVACERARTDAELLDKALPSFNEVDASRVKP
jgi:hypothetical protein